MKSEQFNNAKKCYDKGDYVDALKGYYACLKEDAASFEPGDVGLVYHMLGNCLVKMKRYSDAKNVFGRALADASYDRAGAVRANLGIAHMGCDEYEDAIASFTMALSDPEYKTPYRAYAGLGNANMKLGNYAEAGVAYRNAALDESNPKPAKALVSLADCFTKLERPNDALATLSTALDLEAAPAEVSAIHAQMGIAQHALGDNAAAIESFGKALEGGFELSDEANDAYQAAKVASVDLETVTDWAAPVAAVPADALVSGETTMLDTLESEAQPVWAGQDFLAFNPESDASYGGEFLQTPLAQSDAALATIDQGIGADGEMFFEADPEQLGELDGKGKKKKHVGLKILLAFIIVIVLALGAGFYAYWVGYGYPSQESTIEGLFDAHANGDDVSAFWATDDANVIAQEMGVVASTSNISIDYIGRGTVVSDAIVTATLEQGGTVRYEIDMVRSGGLFGIDALAIGWKVSGIDLAFASTQNDTTDASTVGNVGGTGTSDAGDTDAGTAGDAAAPSGADAAGDAGNAEAGGEPAAQ